MIDSDEILVRSAQRGDGAAFEELVRRTSRLAFARLYLETGDSHLSEDLLQETLLTAFRSLDQLTEPAKFRAWLLRIAQNRAIDAARRNLRQKRLAGRSEQVALANQASGQAQPDEEAERSELRQQVLGVLRTLPEEYRLPLTMRYLSGANYETIQTQMGLTNGSLRGLLHRGMNLLRAELERVLGKELRLHREERTGE
jgi:RNA polymerase sigma-70 factor (ECF subfamily)